jgi:hypothetical protein
MISSPRVGSIHLITRLCAVGCIVAAIAQSVSTPQVAVNRVAEIVLNSEKAYPNPFLEVRLDAMVTQPDGTQLRVPAFWAGGNQWRFRYAARCSGTATWRTECSDAGNLALHGVEGKIEVALYTPLLKAIYLHDRQRGQWGQPLGKVEVPVIGPEIHLTAAVCRSHAAMILTDGQNTYFTPVVQVANTTPGQTGLWLYQVGERQEFDNFGGSRAEFGPVQRDLAALHLGPTAPAPNELPLVMRENPNIVPAVELPEITVLPGADYTLPRLPAPQDWVLVMKRLKP